MAEKQTFTIGSDLLGKRQDILQAGCQSMTGYKHSLSHNLVDLYLKHDQTKGTNWNNITNPV